MAEPDDMTFELEQPGFTVITGNHADDPQVVIDHRCVAKVEWDDCLDYEFLGERQMHISIRTLTNSDGMDLYLGEADARSLRDLLIRFFGVESNAAGWKGRN
jgi:hypothetical protein